MYLCLASAAFIRNHLLHYEALLSGEDTRYVNNYSFILSNYCRMANFSVSFIFLLFPECFQMGINNTGKNNTVPVRT